MSTLVSRSQSRVEFAVGDEKVDEAQVWREVEGEVKDRDTNRRVTKEAIVG